MKKNLTRRDAIQTIGGIAATGVTSGSLVGCVEDESKAEIALAEMPLITEPLTPMTLPGLHAYGEKSLFAGETLHVRVSADTPYQLTIERLGWDVDGPNSDWKQTVPVPSPLPQPEVQPIQPGSYVHVDNNIVATYPMGEFTLECWVRPWQFYPTTGKWQGLMSQYTYPDACGFGLFLDAFGRVVMYFGNGGNFQSAWLRASPSVLALKEWHHVVATFQYGQAWLYINGSEVLHVNMAQSVSPGPAPLRLGAYGANGETAFTFDGDLAMPAIYARAVPATEVAARASQEPPTPATGNVLACWPLTVDQGTAIGDVSGNNRTGIIVNNGTWMIGGPGFAAENVDRFNENYDPQNDQSRGHGLRLSSDDLYDCGWSVTLEVPIAADAKPGVYVARFSYGSDSRYDMTFVVKRPATQQPKPPVLVLCATNTWLAYNVPFPSDPDDEDWSALPGASVPDAPAFCMYRDHAPHQQPGYQVGVNMPWSAFPYAQYIVAEEYSHLLRAERPLHVWLEQNGYDYDVATDLDLAQQSNLLDGYQVVVINGHSEYWTAQGYQRVQAFLGAGGRVIVASGNTMFWRVSYDTAGSVMECRKLADAGLTAGGRPNAKVGEIYHSHDGARGGLMREAGYPAWELIGTESVGYSGTMGTYATIAPTHPFFTTPEDLALSNQEPLGLGAVGHEFDVSRVNIPGMYTPAALPGPQPQSIAELSLAAGSGGTYWDYRVNPQTDGGVRSEIIDWQRADGGRVFAMGSIRAAAKVATEPKLGAMMRNVLHHFGVAQRLNLFVVGSDGKLHTRWFDGVGWGPSYSDWSSLEGDFAGTPEVVVWAPNRLGLLGRQSDGRVGYKYWDGQDWQPQSGPWYDMGGDVVGRPCAVRWGGNNMTVFVQGSDQHMYAKTWLDGTWWPSLSGWFYMGGPFTEPPKAVVFEGNRIGVAAIGTNGQLQYRWWDGTTWQPTTGWMNLGGDLQHGPTFVSWGGNKFTILAVDTSGQLVSKTWDGVNWSPSLTGWLPLGGSLASAPIAVRRDAAKISVYAVGADGRMKAKWFEGSWLPASGLLDMGGSFAGEPAVAGWRGNHVSLMGVSSNGILQYKYWNGSTWWPQNSWEDITGTLSGIQISPAILPWIGTV